ncbi:MAG: hypothetical protein ACE5J2_01715 [Nitrososphaerales archaeon]
MVSKGLYYAAAGTTAIAGILHLLIVPNVIGFDIKFAVFFLVAGIAQLFWALPMIRHWGRAWYYIGIGGTITLIILWSLTRVPNPITGSAGSINEMSITLEALQAAFIGLTAAIIAKEK